MLIPCGHPICAICAQDYAALPPLPAAAQRPVDYARAAEEGRRRRWGDMTDDEEDAVPPPVIVYPAPPPVLRPAPDPVPAVAPVLLPVPVVAPVLLPVPVVAPVVPVLDPPPVLRPAPWLVPEPRPVPVAPAWAPVFDEVFQWEGRPVRWTQIWRFWGLTILLDDETLQPSRGGHTHNSPPAMRGNSVTWHASSDSRNHKWLSFGDVHDV